MLAGGVAKAIATHAEDNFALRADALEAAITPRTKVLMLNFPTNPTGGVVTVPELEKIAALCIKHDLVVLTDEIYSELMYEDAPHTSIASLPGMRERTVLLHGVSKAFAMTGWRIGFACAPKELIEAMMKIHQYAILCAPIMSQEAAIEALDRGEPAMIKMRREYELRRNYIVRGLNDLGLECFKPHGAFYVFPKITSAGLTSREFSMRLLHEEESRCRSRHGLWRRAAKVTCAAATRPRWRRSRSPSNESGNSSKSSSPSALQRPRRSRDGRSCAQETSVRLCAEQDSKLHRGEIVCPLELLFRAFERCSGMRESESRGMILVGPT